MILFDDVTKTYQRSSAPALDGLSIEFERGEFAFLVGASGSGKSTIMRLILKETNPTTGSIFVAGKDLSRIPSWKVPHLRRDIGMVFQDFRLLPSKTAYQNIEFALQVIGTPRSAVKRLVPDMLEMVGLADKGARLPHELSGGEQQRVAIARAYVNRPTILLADEPTGNLDPETARGIMDLLAEINAQGTTVLMATHDEIEVDRMQRRVVELVSGIVIRDELSGRYRGSGEQSVISGSLADTEQDEVIEVLREERTPEVDGADEGVGTPEVSVDEAVRASEVNVVEHDVREPVMPDATTGTHEVSTSDGARSFDADGRARADDACDDDEAGQFRLGPGAFKKWRHAPRPAARSIEALMGEARDVEDEVFAEGSDGRFGDVDEAFEADGFDDGDEGAVR